MKSNRLFIGLATLLFAILAACDTTGGGDPTTTDPTTTDPASLKGTLSLLPNQVLKVGRTVSISYSDEKKYEAYRWYYKESTESDDGYREAPWETDESLDLVFLEPGSYDVKLEVPGVTGTAVLPVTVSDNDEDVSKFNRFVLKKTPTGDYAVSLFLVDFEKIFNTKECAHVDFAFFTEYGQDPKWLRNFDYTYYTRKYTVGEIVDGELVYKEYEPGYKASTRATPILRDKTPADILNFTEKCLADDEMRISADGLSKVMRIDVTYSYTNEFDRFIVGYAVFFETGGLALTNHDLSEFYILSR